MRRIFVLFLVLGASGCSLLVDTAPYTRGRDGGAGRCGDGVVGEGEECDDGNDAAGDGCEPNTCRYSCGGAADCADGEPCNGAEVCDPEAHACRPGTPPAAGAPCAREGVPDGVCREGETPMCVPAGCGNAAVDDGEDCDDGNDATGDGCENDCKFTCTDDAQCDDRDPCNGRERCNEAEHLCERGTALDCDDGDPCTEDTCDRNGCRRVPIDADGDGFAATPDGACAEDCDDADPFTFPGATERCEEAPLVDNDCDGTTDDNPTSSTWYRDCDEDGYAPAGAVTRESCTVPGLEGGCDWTQREPVDAASSDCDDSRSDVSPGQWMYFSEPLSAGSDDDARFGNYDCDGVALYAHGRETADASAACTPGTNLFGGLICQGSTERGWVGSAPACGEEGTLTECTPLTTCTGDECAARADCRRFCLRPFGQSCSADCTGTGCRYEYRCCARTSERVTESCR